MFNNFLFFENLAVFKIMWKNIAQPDWPQITQQCGAEQVRFSFRKTKARTRTHTHTHTHARAKYLMILAS